jgi:hypothetical protein
VSASQQAGELADVADDCPYTPLERTHQIAVQRRGRRQTCGADVVQVDPVKSDEVLTSVRMLAAQQA